jgi:hypothetical protein
VLEGGEETREAAPPQQLSPQITRRLSALRIDTGADYVMFVDLDGRCLAADGQPGDLNTARLGSLLAGTLANAAELAQALRAPQPFTINYQAGATYDLYAASVGAGYLIALVFDARHGRGKIGAVWVYARRAIKELLDLLGSEGPPPPPAAPAEVEPEPVPAQPESAPTAAKAETEPAAAEPVAEPAAETEPAPADAEAGPAVAAPAVVSGEPEEEPQAGVVYSAEEIDAFWDSVLSDEDGETGFRGLTFQEARARGLIPADFDPE